MADARILHLPPTLSKSAFLDLPSDIIYQIATQATTPTKLSLYLTCKSLNSFQLLNISLPVPARPLNSFLRTLERDLPIQDLLRGLSENPHPKHLNQRTPPDSGQWKCLAWTSPTNHRNLLWLFGDDPYFLKFRTAAKVVLCNHPHAQQYLRSLSSVEIYPKLVRRPMVMISRTFRGFVKREERDERSVGNGKVNIVMRRQH